MVYIILYRNKQATAILEGTDVRNVSLQQSSLVLEQLQQSPSAPCPVEKEFSSAFNNLFAAIFNKVLVPSIITPIHYRCMKVLNTVHM